MHIQGAGTGVVADLVVLDDPSGPQWPFALPAFVFIHAQVIFNCLVYA
ncbi:MAG: hypothetical protein SA339_02770 [Methanomassiliicoccus sp.]|nr:hypothetical protein [Methanomassiliicoccus sp.]